MQQYIIDDFTKCKGLTQEELNQDLKLMKLGQYTTPSTKYKICNPIQVSKRQILTSIYDEKSIASDLAKQNNQLLRELTALKKQTQTMKDDIIHHQTQVTVYKLQREVVQRQFELIQQQKQFQMDSLQKYRNKCQNTIALTQNELQSLIGITTESATADQQLMNALQYIRDLQSQLKEQREIIALIKQRELLNSKNSNNSNNPNNPNQSTSTVTGTNTNNVNDSNPTNNETKESVSSLLTLNEKLIGLQNDAQQQRKANTVRSRLFGVINSTMYLIL